MLIVIAIVWFPLAAFIRFRGSSARLVAGTGNDSYRGVYRADAEPISEKLARVETWGEP